MNNKKHICFFVGSIGNKGGTEKMTISLSNELIEIGYKISIISIAPFNHTFFKVDSRVQLQSILDKKSNFLLNLPYILYSLIKLTQEKAIDILIDVDIILSLYSLPVKIFNKTLKIISWEHFNYKTNLGIKRRDYARKLSKKYADAIVTLTEQDKVFYLEDNKAKAKIYTINNFLDKLPREYSKLNNKKVIAVGRFTYQKGFDILVDVWNIVKKNLISKNWVLQIIGDGEDKDLITKKINDLDLTSSIKIIDANPNISDYYLESSIYVMTSRFEGLPMVLIEAKSHGLPIVSFDCLTGPSDLIENGEDGYIIPFANNELLAEKLCFLMLDDTKRKSQGIKAIENSKVYSKDRIVEKWNSLLQSL